MFTSKDIQYLDDRINSLISEYGINNNMDFLDYKFRVSVRHSEVVNILRFVNKHLFYSVNYSINTINPLIDFNDLILFNYLCDKFLEICNYFNKSLGLESFAVLVGISKDTAIEWVNKDEGDELSLARSQALRKVYNYNQDALIANLKESNLGMVAVANNDKGTGLEWTRNQAPQVSKDTVYFLPSERLERLRLENSGADVKEV